jgi:small-conductance mechanosensitive channel
MNEVMNKFIFSKIIQSSLILLLVYLIALLIIRLINRSELDLKRKHSARKLTLYISTLLNVLIIALIWIKNIRTFSVFLTVVGAGLVITLQDIITCIAGWFLIILRRPFDAGDRIEFGDIIGDVIDIRLFQTSLLEVGNWVKADQSTGRIVHIPNNKIFKTQVYNYTRGFEFIWNELKIILTFESNWKKAKEIMLGFAEKEAEKIKEDVSAKIRKMSERYLIYYQKLTPIVYINIVNNGIELSLRYLTEAKLRRITQHQLCQNILDEFSKHDDINFAYPTYRIVK